MDGNMESFLLNNDDDSSSGSELDTDVAVAAGGSAVAAAVQAPSVKAAATAPPQAAPPAPAAPCAARMSQSELSQRLKSLYSPAAKQPNKPSAMQQQQQPPPTQQPPLRQPKPQIPPQQHPPPSQHPPHRSSSMNSARSVSSTPSSSMHYQPRPPQSQQQLPRPPQPQQVQPAIMPPRGRSNDPFEPTPVSKMIKQHQQKQAQRAAAAAGGTTRYPTTTTSSATQAAVQSATMAAAASGQPVDRAAMEREMKKQKERFLIFTRVLLKYLEQKDPPLHQKAKAIIKECADRNKRQERGYESVTASMRARLKEVVNDNYWKRAEAYLEHFLKTKKAAALASASDAQPQQPKSAASSTSSKGSEAARARAEREKQRKLELAKKLQQQAAAARGGSGAGTTQQLNALRQEIDQRRQALKSTPAPAAVAAPAKPTPANKATASVPAATSKEAASKGKGASKGRSPKTPASRAQTPQKSTAAEAPTKPVETTPVVREYSDLMEMVDHAVDFDWTTAGLTLGQKSQLQISQEQHNLLYTEPPPPQQQPQPQPDAFPLPGWGKRNVMTTRIAWARIRLREHRIATGNVPAVGGGILGLPFPKGSEETTEPPSETLIPETAKWFNEEKAEEDKVLAVLSEGTQLYLKSVLEKALHCARQRQNLDGIRIWHQQALSTGDSKPALSLRLGCDVGRQVAQAQGNAAMTCKRMEEALERQSGVPARDRDFTKETLSSATSMSDLALRPKLARGSTDAEYHAKRAFEIYGGKESGEPPLGQVPSKKAKLEVVDFEMGQNFVGPGRHRAGTVSSSFFY